MLQIYGFLLCSLIEMVNEQTDIKYRQHSFFWSNMKQLLNITLENSKENNTLGLKFTIGKNYSILHSTTNLADWF